MLLVHKKEFQMARRLTCALYGNDQGAIDVLGSIADAAALDLDVHILRIPGLDLEISPVLRERLYRCDAAVFGISTQMPEATLAMEALTHNPMLSGNMFFAEDFPGSSGIQDPILRSIGRHARLCSIMTLPDDAPERSVYRSVHAVGCPDHWLPSIRQIQAGMDLRSSGVLRKKRRGTREEIPIDRSDVIVYVSGFKEPAYETHVLQYLYTLRAAGGKPLLIDFRPHPGERSLAVQQAIERRDALLKDQWEIVMPAMNHAEAFMDSLHIGLSDIAIAHPGATSTFLVGSLRKKMICVRAFIQPWHREESSYDYSMTGRTTHVIDRLMDLPTAIEALTQEDSPQSLALRKKQAAHALPFDPTQGSRYGRNIIDLLKRMVA
jgi:hypothetical protein